MANRLSQMTLMIHFNRIKLIINSIFSDQAIFIEEINRIYYYYSKMQQIKHIFITGANRGLGRSLVRVLAKQHPNVELHISSRGNIKDLEKQWHSEIPNIKINAYQIDLNSLESIRQNIHLIREKNVTIDTIVANAAVGCDYGEKIPSHQVAKSTLQTNVDSTITFVKEFLPVLSEKGRVVIVSSIMGALQPHSPRLQKVLKNPSLTQQEILNISRDYVESASKKDMKDYHWSAYRTSKALINAWSQFCLPKYLKEGQTSISLHPGWCQTDMGGKQAPLSEEEGARRINIGIWIKQTNPSLFFNQKFVNFDTCA